MGSPQDYAGRLARLERFLPARRTQAPAIAEPQAGKAEFWHRRRKVIAAGFGKLEELSSHDRADGMTTDVFSTRIAASVSEEPRQGLHRAVFESVAKNIPGRLPAPSVPAGIPQHRRPLDSRHVSNTHNRRPTTVGAGAYPRSGGRAPGRSEPPRQSDFRAAGRRDKLARGIGVGRTPRCGNCGRIDQFAAVAFGVLVPLGAGTEGSQSGEKRRMMCSGTASSDRRQGGQPCSRLSPGLALAPS